MTLIFFSSHVLCGFGASLSASRPLLAVRLGRFLPLSDLGLLASGPRTVAAAASRVVGAPRGHVMTHVEHCLAPARAGGGRAGKGWGAAGDRLPSPSCCRGQRPHSCRAGAVSPRSAEEQSEAEGGQAGLHGRPGL